MKIVKSVDRKVREKDASQLPQKRRVNEYSRNWKKMCAVEILATWGSDKKRVIIRKMRILQKYGGR